LSAFLIAAGEESVAADVLLGCAGGFGPIDKCRLSGFLELEDVILSRLVSRIIIWRTVV